jgi:hypothetical protein
MRKFYLFVIAFVSVTAFSQSANDYKYAVVPSKFSFLKEADQYRLNTYTKMFMQKYGFETWFDNENIPAEIANSNCNKVYVDVIENNTMFITKLKVVLKDCTNKILYTSAEGQSREKDFKTAYTQALRDAFNSLELLHHKYNGKNTSETVVEKIDTEPVDVKSIAAGNAAQITILQNVKLAAVTTKTGYELILMSDSEAGKKVMDLLKTSQKNSYIAVAPDHQGVLVNVEGNWLFEYYTAGKMVSQQLIIPNLKAE